ncbi:hypothetical protein [Synechococcus sp. BIOS-E4-1]|uniref:hypothetical protein n=1 Tax=Synechococcus sp. BIOS-E4-1 TaxID=1400864 RepID=UPI001CA45D27|nr:hypothetical protein [Synechococcus sp. BIOS-E4-1]
MQGSPLHRDGHSLPLLPRPTIRPGFRTDRVANSVQRTPLLDLTDFKRDLSELTDRLGNAQDCL